MLHHASEREVACDTLFLVRRVLSLTGAAHSRKPLSTKETKTVHRGWKLGA